MRVRRRPVEPQKKEYRLPKLLVWLEQTLERRRSRHALMQMSDDQLKDIGVSRAEAYGEANRPFWD
ncbi:MAG: DUF1127 domain-containing protein [Rhizobiaceae bacterium]